MGKHGETWGDMGKHGETWGWVASFGDLSNFDFTKGPNHNQNEIISV